MSDLLKRDNETDLEYVKRIVYGKLIDKTIDDDYTILAPLVFGKDYSSDVARRMFYGARDILKLVDTNKINNIEDNDVISQIEEKTLELEKERKKLQATKIEYNRNIRNESRQELLYENIKESQERLPIPNFKPIDSECKDGTYILSWADIHYGADFISENNIYNREECRRRFELLTGKGKGTVC